MSEFLLPLLEGDSDDLADIEIASAIQTSRLEDVTEALREARCPHCGMLVKVSGHDLRRNKSRYFWRTRLVCDSNHTSSKLFAADWWRGRS